MIWVSAKEGCVRVSHLLCTRGNLIQSLCFRTTRLHRSTVGGWTDLQQSFLFEYSIYHDELRFSLQQLHTYKTGALLVFAAWEKSIGLKFFKYRHFWFSATLLKTVYRHDSYASALVLCFWVFVISKIQLKFIILKNFFVPFWIPLHLVLNRKSSSSMVWSLNIVSFSLENFYTFLYLLFLLKSYAEIQNRPWRHVSRDASSWRSLYKRRYLVFYRRQLISNITTQYVSCKTIALSILVVVLLVEAFSLFSRYDKAKNLRFLRRKTTKLGLPVVYNASQ